MPLSSGQVGVLPGIPVVLLGSGEGRLSLLSNKGMKMIMAERCPEALKECGVTVIKPLNLFSLISVLFLVVTENYHYVIGIIHCFINIPAIDIGTSAPVPSFLFVLP